MWIETLGLSVRDWIDAAGVADTGPVGLKLWLGVPSWGAGAGGGSGFVAVSEYYWRKPGESILMDTNCSCVF